MNQPSADQSLLFGHRGSPRAKHENTLESFQLALEAGPDGIKLDGIELDVQRSLNGVLVVHHDFFLPDGRLIAALNDHEIIRLELPGGLRVPTLEAVLNWAKDAGAYVNVEIKSESTTSDGRETQTVRLIERLGMNERVIISSFNPASILRVRLANARLETALLYDNEAGSPWYLEDARLAPLLGVRAIHPHHSLVTPELIARAKARGWRVNVWTVNDLELGVKLLEVGVNALIGDDPAILLGARDRFLHAKTSQNRLA